MYNYTYMQCRERSDHPQITASCVRACLCLYAALAMNNVFVLYTQYTRSSSITCTYEHRMQTTTILYILMRVFDFWPLLFLGRRRSSLVVVRWQRQLSTKYFKCVFLVFGECVNVGVFVLHLQKYLHALRMCNFSCLCV